MHILNNLKNYLYDRDYVINIYENHLYLFNYVEVIELTSDSLKIKFKDFRLEINGKDFLVYKMTNTEMLIKGNINTVRFDYEKHN